MKALKKALILNPLFYVTRDIERAIGLDLNTSGYFIISNNSPFSKSLAKKNKNIFLVDENKLLDTWELLKNEGVIKYINKNATKPNIIVFKNTNKIEEICNENNWRLLNTPANLADKIEQKISQVKWAGKLKKYFPNYQIVKCRDIKWQNKPIIIQFNYSHTGSGTILIEKEK